MNKIAFIFPGQGSQYVGMGRKLYDNFKEAKEVFNKANQILGFDLAKVCFEGPEEELNRDLNAQLGVFTVSIATYEVLKKKGITPAIIGEHSLGIYAALVACQALNFEKGLKITKKAGELMGEVPGGMVAIIGLGREEVEEICRLTRVFIANHNSPRQFVISGEKEALNKAIDLAKKDALEVVPLNLSNPLHTTLMEGVSQELASYLKTIEIKDPKIPLINHYDAHYLKNKRRIREILTKQLTSPVLWEESIRRILSIGIDTFLEVGPGEVLSQLIQWISRKAKILHLKDLLSS